MKTFITNLEKNWLNKAANWGFVIAVIGLIIINFTDTSIYLDGIDSAGVEITRTDISQMANDSAVVQAESVMSEGKPSFDLDNWDPMSGLPIVHAYVAGGLGLLVGAANAVLLTNIIASLISLFLIRRLAISLWSIQEMANFFNKIDIEEIIEDVGEAIGDVGEAMEDIGGNLPESTSHKEEFEPSVYAHLFSVLTMCSYLFYVMKSNVSTTDPGIALSQMFTLIAIHLSTAKLSGDKPKLWLIGPTLLLAMLSSTIGVFALMPVTLFLILGELKANNETASLKKKLAMAFLGVLFGGLIAFSLASSLTTDYLETASLFISGLTNGMVEFAPLIALLTVIPLKRLKEPIERSMVIYGGSLFALTFFLPQEIQSQIQYAIIIPGSILGSFAVVGMIEDFLSDLVENIAKNAAKFFVTLGGLPLASTIIEAGYGAMAKGTGFMGGVSASITGTHLVMIGTGLTGIFFMLVKRRSAHTDE